MIESFLPIVIIILLLMVLEALFLIIKKNLNWNLREIAINFLLGISNLVVGLLFAGINLGLYLYIYNNFSLHLEPTNKLLAIGFAILLYDFLYYVSHLAHHKCAILWCNHFVHHSGKTFNLSTAIRIGFIGNFTVWLFFLPMACIGISLENYLIANFTQLVYQFLLHTTIIPELGIFEKILVTPSQHRVHHASNDIYLDKNLGCFFVVWDKLFKTYQPELKDVPVVYGVTTPVPCEHSHWSLNILPYKSLKRTVMRTKLWKEKFLTVFGNPKYIKFFTNESGSIYQGKTTNENIFNFVEYISPIFTGLYLALNFQNLGKFESFAVTTIFFLGTNLAGQWFCQTIKRKYMLYTLLLQMILGVYMIITIQTLQVVVFLMVSFFIFMFIILKTYNVTNNVE